MLSLLILSMGCDYVASWVATGSTGGSVTVGFSFDNEDRWVPSGPVDVPDGRIVNWPGGDDGDVFPYCEHDKDQLPDTVTYRVTDPDDAVLWEEPIASLHLCDGDRVVWDGTELRKLEPDEPWPDQLER